MAMRNREGTWVGYLLSTRGGTRYRRQNGDTALIIAAQMGFEAPRGC